MAAFPLFFIFALILFLSLSNGQYFQSPFGRGQAYDLIAQRLEILRRVATSTPRKSPCSTDRVIVVTEIPWGQTSNNLIIFSHGLYLADKLNATFIVPTWISHILRPFDTRLLKSLFCFTETDLSTDIEKEKLEITSEDSFFLYKIFLDKSLGFQDHLPPLNEQTVLEVSNYFLRIYSALWSRPLPNILFPSLWIIENHLNNTFRYTAVHKRAMEGGCNKLLSEVTSPSDYPPGELPMGRPEWRDPAALRARHPVCEMAVDFVQETQLMLGRGGGGAGVGGGRWKEKIFLAHDGAGSIEGYREVGAVLSHVLEVKEINDKSSPLSPFTLISDKQQHENYLQQQQQKSDPNSSSFSPSSSSPSSSFSPIPFFNFTSSSSSSPSPLSLYPPSSLSYSHSDRKFIDMFLSIHSDLFLLNPRSTLSFQVYVIRSALSLQSVPVLRNKDLYVCTDKERSWRKEWTIREEGKEGGEGKEGENNNNNKISSSSPPRPLPPLRPLWVSFSSILSASLLL